MDKERRKFKRFDAYMSVKYKSPEADAVNGMSLSKDLSRDGIMVNAPKGVKVGTLIDLEISIPDDPKPVRSTGKVMWARPSAGDKQGYDHGVKFMNIDPVDKFRVLDYAYNHWLESKVNDFVDPEDISELE